MSKPNYPECERCGGEDCACCEVWVEAQQSYMPDEDYGYGRYGPNDDEDDDDYDYEDDSSYEDVAPLLRKMCQTYAELLRVDFGPAAAWEQVYQMWQNEQ